MKVFAIYCVCITFVNFATALPITWMNAPTYQIAVAGQDYFVQCRVTAIPEPEMVWYRNREPIVNHDRYSIQPNGLLIKDVEESDNGFYTCRAKVLDLPSKISEEADRKIHLEVLQKPKIVIDVHSEDQSSDHSYLILKCDAIGKPTPTITWINEKENLEVYSERSNSSTVESRILRVQRSDHDDEYSCHATNMAGEDQERIIIKARGKH